MGYIGSVLAQEALKRGHEVCLYDSLIYEQDIERMMLEIAGEGERPRLIIGDTRNKALLKKSLKEFKPTWVFHLAELSSVYMCDHNPTYTKAINNDATKGVFDICADLKLKVVYNSTSSVYGAQKEMKLSLESDRVPRPYDHYVLNKLKTEDYAKHFNNIITLRPATVFGLSPRYRIELLPNHFTYMAVCRKSISISDASSFRAAIEIHELVEGYFKIMAKGSWKHKIYNIGHFNFSKGQFAEELQKILDCDTKPVIVQDTRNLQIDCSRFDDEFDFHPTTSYSEHIRKVVNWTYLNAENLERTNFTEVLNMPLAKWKSLCA